MKKLLALLNSKLAFKKSVSALIAFVFLMAQCLTLGPQALLAESVPTQYEKTSYIQTKNYTSMETSTATGDQAGTQTTTASSIEHSTRTTDTTTSTAMDNSTTHWMLANSKPVSPTPSIQKSNSHAAVSQANSPVETLSNTSSLPPNPVAATKPQVIVYPDFVVQSFDTKGTLLRQDATSLINNPLAPRIEFKYENGRLLQAVMTLPRSTTFPGLEKATFDFQTMRLTAEIPALAAKESSIQIHQGKIEVSFNSSAGKRYVIQKSFDLSSSTWKNVGELQGTGAAMTYKEAVSGTSGFFRVVEVLPAKVIFSLSKDPLALKNFGNLFNMPSIRNQPPFFDSERWVPDEAQSKSISSIASVFDGLGIIPIEAESTDISGVVHHQIIQNGRIVKDTASNGETMNFQYNNAGQLEKIIKNGTASNRSPSTSTLNILTQIGDKSIENVGGVFVVNHYTLREESTPLQTKVPAPSQEVFSASWFSSDLNFERMTSWYNPLTLRHEAITGIPTQTVWYQDGRNSRNDETYFYNSQGRMRLIEGYYDNPAGQPELVWSSRVIRNNPEINGQGRTENYFRDQLNSIFSYENDRIVQRKYLDSSLNAIDGTKTPGELNIDEATNTGTFKTNGKVTLLKDIKMAHWDWPNLDKGKTYVYVFGYRGNGMYEVTVVPDAGSPNSPGEVNFSFNTRNMTLGDIQKRLEKNTNLGDVNESILRESLDFSRAHQKEVLEAYQSLVQANVMPRFMQTDSVDDPGYIPVLFLKGLPNQESFALALTENPGMVVVGYEAFAALPDAEAQKRWLITKIAHEAIHVLDRRNNPNIAPLETERNGYLATYQSLKYLDELQKKDNPSEKKPHILIDAASLKAQENVSLAFDLLVQNPEQVTGILGLQRDDFNNLNYQDDRLLSDTQVQILIYDMDNASNQKWITVDLQKKTIFEKSQAQPNSPAEMLSNQPKMAAAQSSSGNSSATPLPNVIVPQPPANDLRPTPLPVPPLQTPPDVSSSGEATTIATQSSTPLAAINGIETSTGNTIQSTVVTTTTTSTTQTITTTGTTTQTTTSTDTGKNPVVSQPKPTDHVFGELIVRFKEEAKSAVEGFKNFLTGIKDAVQNTVSDFSSSLTNAFMNLGVKAVEKLFGAMNPASDAEKALDNMYLVKYDEAAHPFENAKSTLENNDWVEYVDPNVLFQVVTPTSNALSPAELNNLLNQNISELWHLDKTNVPEAWALFDLNHNGQWDPGETQPGKGVTVAFIDTGMDFNHPALFNNVWVNAQEIAYAVGDQNGDGKITSADANFNQDFMPDGKPRISLEDIDGLIRTRAGKIEWSAARQDGKVSPDELAVLFDGIDNDNDNHIDDILSWNFDTTNGNGNDISDNHFHGTYVAGIIGARSADGEVMGVAPWATLMGVKVGNEGTNIKLSNVLSGMGYAIFHNADIINLSLGGEASGSGRDFRSFSDVTYFAHLKNIVVVAAAGNEGKDTKDRVLANTPGMITVGGTDKADHRAMFGTKPGDTAGSNYGNDVDIAAPAIGIHSTMPGEKYDSYNGTSAAAPQVAGVAALIKTLNPQYTPDQILSDLTKSAQPYTADQYLGKGILNAEGALKSALEQKNNTPPPTNTDPVPTAPWSKPEKNSFLGQGTEFMPTPIFSVMSDSHSGHSATGVSESNYSDCANQQVCMLNSYDVKEKWVYIGDVRSYKLQGNYLYVMSPDSTIHIFDLSDRAYADHLNGTLGPEIGTIRPESNSSPAEIKDFALAGNKAYILKSLPQSPALEQEMILEIYDVTQPKNLKLEKTIKLTRPSSQNPVERSAGLVEVLDSARVLVHLGGNSGIQIVNTNTGQVEGTIPSESVNGMYAFGTKVYVTQITPDGGVTLESWDLNNPKEPHRLASGHFSNLGPIKDLTLTQNSQGTPLLVAASGRSIITFEESPGSLTLKNSLWTGMDMTGVDILSSKTKALAGGLDREKNPFFFEIDLSKPSGLVIDKISFYERATTLNNTISLWPRGFWRYDVKSNNLENGLQVGFALYIAGYKNLAQHYWYRMDYTNPKFIPQSTPDGRFLLLLVEDYAKIPSANDQIRNTFRIFHKTAQAVMLVDPQGNRMEEFNQDAQGRPVVINYAFLWGDKVQMAYQSIITDPATGKVQLGEQHLLELKIDIIYPPVKTFTTDKDGNSVETISVKDFDDNVNETKTVTNSQNQILSKTVKIINPQGFPTQETLTIFDSGTQEPHQTTVSQFDGRGNLLEKTIDIFDSQNLLETQQQISYYSTTAKPSRIVTDTFVQGHLQKRLDENYNTYTQTVVMALAITYNPETGKETGRNQTWEIPAADIGQSITIGETTLAVAPTQINSTSFVRSPDRRGGYYKSISLVLEKDRDPYVIVSDQTYTEIHIDNNLENLKLLHERIMQIESSFDGTTGNSPKSYSSIMNTVGAVRNEVNRKIFDIEYKQPLFSGSFLSLSKFDLQAQNIIKMAPEYSLWPKWEMEELRAQIVAKRAELARLLQG